MPINSAERNLQRLMPREVVRRFWCPRCHAQPGNPCRGRNKRPRISNHYERVEVALA